MKKTLFAISAIAVLLGFTACTSENEIVEPQVNGKTITIKATTEQPSATRTKLGEGEDTNYPVLWTADDKIRIVSATNYADFTLKNDYANQSTGEFEGSFDFNNNEEYSAYYPATYYDNDNSKTIWPATQTYVVNNIPDGVPMKATFTYSGEEPSIAFKNEGGILRLNLMGTAKVKSITVSATDLDPITLDCGEGVEKNKNKTCKTFKTC